MIIDKIENSDLYFSGGKFGEAFDFIRNTDLYSLACGSYEIKGKEIYALVNEYNSKELSEGKVEAHKKYIDLQYVIRGEENIGYALKNNQDFLEPYNPEKDFILYKADVTLFPMKEGMFMILFPDDLHMPGIKLCESIPVKKLVIKIAV